MNRIRIASLALTALVIALGATWLIVRFSGRVDNAEPAVGDLPSEGHRVRGNGEPSVAVGHDDLGNGAVRSSEMHRLKGVHPHQPPVILHTTAHAFAAFADGSRVVCANYEFAELWDLTTGEKVLSLPHPEIVLGCAISPDEKSLLTVTAGRASPVRLWSLVSGEIVREYPSPFEGNCSASEKEFRESSGWNLWDHPRTWRFPRRGYLPETGFGFTAVAFSPRGDLVAAGCEDGTILFWNVQEQQDAQRIMGNGKRMILLLFSPDSRRLLTASMTDVIQLWDVRNGALVSEFEESRDKGRDQNFRIAAAFSGDSAQFAFYGPRTKAIHVCDALTGRELRQLAEPSRRLSFCGAMAFVSDKNKLVSDASSEIKLWDLAQATLVRHHFVPSVVFSHSRAPVEFVRFLPRIASVMVVEVQNVSETGHEDWTIISIVPLSAFQEVYRR